MHAETYLKEVAEITAAIDPAQIEHMAQMLSEVKGRIYCIGLGGSLANAMHMAADFRKLCNLDAVAPDNMAELTAWANDAGWKNLFEGYLASITAQDTMFVLSVGGGTDEVSVPLTEAVKQNFGGPLIFGIVGPNGGETTRLGDCVIRIPAPENHVTPHTEAFQAVIWHCLICHPLLQKRPTKW